MFYPSIGVFRGLVVVPDAQPSDALGFTEIYAQRVCLSIGERNEPHVFVAGSDVEAINEPEGRQGHQNTVTAFTPKLLPGRNVICVFLYKYIL